MGSNPAGGVCEKPPFCGCLLKIQLFGSRVLLNWFLLQVLMQRGGPEFYSGHGHAQNLGLKSQNMPSRAKNCLKYTSLMETATRRLESSARSPHTPWSNWWVPKVWPCQCNTQTIVWARFRGKLRLLSDLLLFPLKMCTSDSTDNDRFRSKNRYFPSQILSKYKQN